MPFNQVIKPKRKNTGNLKKAPPDSLMLKKRKLESIHSTDSFSAISSIYPLPSSDSADYIAAKDTSTDFIWKIHNYIDYNYDKNKSVPRRKIRTQFNDKSSFVPYVAFSELTGTQKTEIIDHALTFARAAQNSVDNSKKQFNYKNERIIRHEIEWHRKFTLSFACFIFFFIGAPLGAIIRKGGFGVSVVISILFFIFYYILSIAGEKFAREAVMPAYIGMWISSFVLMPLGIFLTYKATTDSVIFNADSYLIFFKKIFNKFSKKEIEEN